MADYFTKHHPASHHRVMRQEKRETKPRAANSSAPTGRGRLRFPRLRAKSAGGATAVPRVKLLAKRHREAQLFALFVPDEKDDKQTKKSSVQVPPPVNLAKQLVAERANTLHPSGCATTSVETIKSVETIVVVVVVALLLLLPARHRQARSHPIIKREGSHA